MSSLLKRESCMIHANDHIIRALRAGTSYFIRILLLATAAVTGLTATVFAMAGQPGGGQPQGPGALISSFLPLILIFVIFYFLLIRPQSKKAKDHKQMLESLKKGDKVMTNGGIHGIIEDIDSENITLKIGIGSDVKIKVNRNYVAGLRTKE